MEFYCNDCQKFIADIKRFNYMNLKGKSYEITKNSIKIKCKCGKENTISLNAIKECN